MRRYVLRPPSSTCVFSRARSTSGHGNFVSITSPDLCDSVIERLAPTFNRNIPCDVVDIYPHGRFWSTKIHDFLKPRTHLLIEPRERYWGAWLKPLLTRPDSTFKHRPWEPAFRETLSKVFDDDVLGEGSRGADGSGDDQLSNRRLLILLNIARLHQTVQKKSGFLNSYFLSLLDNSSIHRYGMVRLIVVSTAKHADVLLPRTLNRRKRIALLAEATSKVTQVAGIDPPKLNWELKGLETVEKSASRASEREKAASTSVPARRIAKPVQLAPSAVYIQQGRRGARDYVYTPRPKKHWHDEYLDLERKFLEGKLNDKAERRRFSDRQRRLLDENRHAALLDELAVTQKHLDKLEEELRQMKEKGDHSVDEAKRVSSEIQQLSTKRDTQYGALNDSFKLCATHQAEERRCFEDSGDGEHLPLLQWDRRPYEPLHVTPDEFNPNVECSVLDIQPDPNSPLISRRREYMRAGKTDEYLAILRVFLYLGRLLVYSGRKPLGATLQALFPGRPMSELIDAMPSLARIAKVSVSITPESKEKDGKDGSNEEKAILEYADDCLSTVSLRTLPASIIWDIAAEWHKYPFKPVPETDLHKVLGGGNVDSRPLADDEHM